MHEDHLITPAGEWLLDNFYLIEDNIHTGKKHLPKEYSASLPKLANTRSADLPRVYGIALEMISHSDGHIDLESLKSFISAYQTVVTLQIGELWAVPIMLRLALIENLRRVSVRVALDRINQNLADYWASQMISTAENDPKNLILVIADMARSGPPMESSFVAELIRQLIWKGPSIALPLTWMEQRLAETGLTSNELVNLENQKQAADQVSISNCINSLRSMGSIEWKDFVEELSDVEKILRTDAGGVYPKMDFTTRDRYRHIVEKIAKYSKVSEREVARIAINLAQENKSRPGFDDRSSHVGYFLSAEGVAQTEQLAGQKLSGIERIKKSVRKHPLLFYAGGITLLSLIIATYFTGILYYRGLSPFFVVLMGVISLLAASHLATSLVNWVATIFFSPESLPRLDFSKGIPADAATLVVVPTMLINADQIGKLIEMLEVRFLANRDENLYFGLLTDFRDAQAEVLPEDDILVATATTKIEELNKKYSSNGNSFFLFHRPRKWNPTEKVWMGYERKRGKLTELNALLRGKGKDFFSQIVGNIASLAGVRYVITLDTDTQLPHDAGWKLVGAMAHPLNVPVYDQKMQRIVRGYGVLQPRVSVSLSRAGNSRYSLMHGNEPGIDPYTRLTSDVYQDLFEEGSFVGKGIYDIDAFEMALNGRFPENRILSHDLLEGCYTRAGLLTDVQFYEEYPMRYSTDVNRRHRWIRGDWQIGRWILAGVPDATGKRTKNKLSALSRWKIFDNLRRSLVPIALTILMMVGWFILRQAWVWTLSVVLIVMFQSIISLAWGLLKKSDEFTLWQHLESSFASAFDNLARNAFMFICLPYEAYYSIDAIFRTSWRLFISRTRLLEWTPSGSQEHSNDKTVISAYSFMWFSPALALTTFVLLTMGNAFMLMVAMPILMSWLLAPFIAWWVGKPITSAEAGLTDKNVVFLRGIARKTWSFFETFVGHEDNWLPPDNYQLWGKTQVAHRTSPTNIGISLLANLSAYDFGYLTATDLIDRTEQTMLTLGRMERYQLHFYNWYDTVTLTPLLPKYISTVDSGNMAGHLLTLRQGLLAIPFEKTPVNKKFEGLRDTIGILNTLLPGSVLVKQLSTDTEFAVNTYPLTYATAKKFNNILLMYATELCRDVDPEGEEEVYFWARKLEEQCKRIEHEFSYLFPWLSLGNIPSQFLVFFNSLERETLYGLSELGSALPEIQSMKMQGNAAAENEWLDSLAATISTGVKNAKAQIASIGQLERQCAVFADFNYDFLYDKSKNLLAIGYNVDEHRRDTGYYDLLASEANLSSFVAIAQGKLPPESWFALGRLLTYGDGAPMLLSWSGSMFEYLMPLLVMPDYEDTLLSQTHKNVVTKQIKYANERGLPWGISESCYNAVDANLNYQYKAFGVPGTGLKRGLAEDLVIAPYASVLALMVSPADACRNLERLSAEGVEGKYGYYEAVDYTQSRLPRGQSRVIIQSFMAHHQGMSLLSLAYALLGQPMQKRFEAELQFRSAMLLLQERVPKTANFFSNSAEATTTISSAVANTEIRVITTPDTPIPEVQLLSNGKYHVMITNAGGGYSKWKNIAVTRWKEDTTCDNWGAFCYIRDLSDNSFWSNTHQPVLKATKHYEATFTQGRAEFRRTDNNIETYTEIVVSPEDDIEMRRVHIINRSRRERSIDITTYSEVVLSTQASDNQHPAFNKLFINTEIIPSRNAILCNRRPRSTDDHTPWMFHILSHNGYVTEEASFETDRMKFIGRGKDLSLPASMENDGRLSGTEGPVIDPIVSIRQVVRKLGPDETIVFDIITGVCATRDECLALIEKYQEKYYKDRVFELAWTHSQVVLRQINATEADAQLYGRLASSILFTNAALRTDAAVIAMNQKGQSGLWGYSISGDLPIVLLEIEDPSNIQLVKQLVQAHTYWWLKGIAVDLVIWNEDRSGYRQSLQNEIFGLVTAGIGSELTGHPGGIFVRAAEQIAEEDRLLMRTVAKIIISDKKGSLSDQINKKPMAKNIIPFLLPGSVFSGVSEAITLPADLIFFNDFGGFSPDGTEYVIVTTPEKRTPLPWANVLANPEFGCIISEAGQSYTWLENAHEFRLTPWENDPVCDKGGEAFYIRDEETGHYWSPFPMPAGGPSPYITRHGFGYSTFRHTEVGVETHTTVHVDLDSPVKFVVIKLTNKSGSSRRLSVTGYVEWVLGDHRSKTGMHVVTELNLATGAMLARNPYCTEFCGMVAFFDTDDKTRTVTGDRTEFIGRNGTLNKPASMAHQFLSGTVGAALDPCAALQVAVTLAAGEEREIVFRLGAGATSDDAIQTIAKFKGTDAASDSLNRVRKYWSDTLGRLQVETPDQALNILTNGWLMYQTIVCRLWARSGYYQSGGAFGYRDQLQDVLAVLPIDPAIARKQILLCASRQFPEGDVQHWWHPPVGRGVRTRCSDDLLWLPFVVSSYVAKTGDKAILEEQIAFLDGRQLNPNEPTYYDLPTRSEQIEDLYGHCVKAIEHALKFGVHGLPLIGHGDWNDGMDLIGKDGKGESVWLGFFLFTVLTQFSVIAGARVDDAFKEKCQHEAKQLQANLEKNGWDGNWYRRAYFDDGTPLGSRENEECKIDSISQSWAVLSEAGDPIRSKVALEQADRYLVDKKDKIIKLLYPPFDTSAVNPGYIKGYVPGIRENGGQYTHAAVWMIMAYAKLGNAPRAWELMDLLNPIHHADSKESAAVYKVEPYVMAADIYSVAQNCGRGGWTWYTGSAGWMYQLTIESLLGMNLAGDRLTFTPCIPLEWKSFKITYKYLETIYQITIVRTNANNLTAQNNSIAHNDKSILLVNDQLTHEIVLSI